MIGLKRNTVKIIPYQKEWNTIYKEIEINLNDLLKEEIQFIEHIGSTAILGMASKPIIDVAVAIENFDKIKKIQQILSQHNYEDRGRKVGGYLFVKREDGLTTQHIHFMLNSSKKWIDYISFRNKLNSQDKLRKQYAELKLRLAKKHPNNRGDYTKSKNKFIRKVLMLTEKEKNTAPNNS